MKNTKNYLYLLLVAGLVLILSACNLQTGAQETQDPQLIYTAAAQTVQAQLTQAVVPPTSEVLVTPVLPTETSPIVPTITSVIPATNTPVPTAVPPTAVPPTPTQIPIPCDRGTFVTDVTYKDGTEVTAGTTFVKTWRLRNNGSCTWNSSYAVVFESGDALGGPAAVQLTTGTVAPGQEVDISVTLKAPETAKTYQGYWKLRNGSGLVFGLGADAKAAFWVKVTVVNPVTPTPAAVVTYDLISKAPSAVWSTDAGPLAYGDADDDAPGVAVTVDSLKLENGNTYNRVLATYPHRITNGYIKGIFPSYVVQANDKLRYTIGLKYDCTGGKVRYQLKYLEGATETLLGEWVETCDNTLVSVEKDLSTLAGKTIQLVLIVSTEGDFVKDFAVWVNPRIEH